MEPDSHIYKKSCESMSELEDSSVSLTITSPPYWNAIDYDSHVDNSDADYRVRKEVNYRDEYLPFLKRCFSEVFRVHADGSFCAVVIGTVLLNQHHTPLPYDFTSMMQEIGWEFHQDIIWYKCTGGVKRAGSTIRSPYPGYYYPNLMIEYILVFKKPGEGNNTPKIYEGKTKKDRDENAFDIDAVFKYDIANNIWHIAPVPPGQIDHPCPFPEEIPYRLIRLYSYQNDLVLDPFAGTGTTLKVAANLERRWVGYEINDVYINTALKRIEEPLSVRKQLISRFEKVDYGEEITAKNKTRPPFKRRKPKV